jgi:hypothetical protein
MICFSLSHCGGRNLVLASRLRKKSLALPRQTSAAESRADFAGSYGTTEVVPFPNISLPKGFSAACCVRRRVTLAWVGLDFLGDVGDLGVESVSTPD